MIEGMIQAAKEDVVRTAARGGLLMYAGLLAALAHVFIAIAIVFALEPVVGRAFAYLAAGFFLLLVCGVFILIALNQRRRDRMLAREAAAARAAAPAPAGGGLAALSGLLTSGLTTGLLERELRDHPLRSLAAALAAGTVMGIMESRDDDKD